MSGPPGVGRFKGHHEIEKVLATVINSARVLSECWEPAFTAAVSALVVIAESPPCCRSCDMVQFRPRAVTPLSPAFAAVWRLARVRDRCGLVAKFHDGCADPDFWRGLGQLHHVLWVVGARLGADQLLVEIVTTVLMLLSCAGCRSETEIRGSD